ncbi:uncharacterized protein (DUF983 family) [Peribacillus deserti]|uniref:Uncharacterized protein (DUF983 family) n=1 Tax=Peribacillus deserti TaxID=673318 RepID=A0ABS2QEN3_9BACI|nr:hypothetical protein [Peribacillus deserti]MBM7691610.1 uncharacterized protein (DUF983 family) [Peribacillus deserti]
MKTEVKTDVVHRSQGSPLSFFIKGNMVVAFVVIAFLINSNRWSEDAWFAILVMVIGFEIVTLLTVLIVKIKPDKKH